MAIDFPASPSLNQLFGTWRWDGAKWVQSSQAPVVQSFNGRAGAVMFQQSDAAGVGLYTDTGRNLIHNGRFEVAQRGAGPWTASGSYTADRWIIYTSLDTDSLNVTTLADADRTQIGDETAQYAIANTFTGNAGAASYSVIQQHIERQRRLAGRTITVSFWAWAGTAGLKLGVAFSQNFGTGGSPSAQVSPNGTAVTLAVAWTRYTVTLTVPSVSGKTFGTNGDDYFGLEFWYSCGASNNAHAGSIGVQSGGVILWGIQLEIGTVATPLAKREYGEELRLCQRYFSILQSFYFGGYGAAGGQFIYNSAIFPVQMRAPPTVTFSNVSYGNASGLSINAGSNRTLVPLYATLTAAGNGYCAADIAASADL